MKAFSLVYIAVIVTGIAYLWGHVIYKLAPVFDITFKLF